MPVNKVVYNTTNGAVTLIDLTDSTVTPETLAEGAIAYNAQGERIVGTATFGGSGLSTFTIDGTSYQFEEGMTWHAWGATDYNTTGGYPAYGYFIIGHDDNVVQLNGVNVKESDKIQSGAAYTTYLQVCEIENDYGILENFYFTKGMTWGEWVESDYNTTKLEIGEYDNYLEGYTIMPEDDHSLALSGTTREWAVTTDVIVAGTTYEKISW